MVEILIKWREKMNEFLNGRQNILKKADHVIAVGNDLAKDIINDFHINEEKISLIKYGSES